MKRPEEPSKLDQTPWSSDQARSVQVISGVGVRTKFLYFVPKGSFGLAESCISLLADARRIAEEELPDLAKCKNWGPGYYHETNSAKIERHVFGMEMWPGIRGQSRLICGIEFSAEEGRPIRWLVAHYGSQAKNSSEKRRAIKNFFDGKVLDPARLARAIVEAANEWKFL